MNRLIAALMTLPLIAAGGTGAYVSVRRNVDITSDGTSEYVIVRPDDSEFAVTAAASNLSRAVKKETDADIKVVTDNTARYGAGAEKPKEIIIGLTDRGIPEKLGVGGLLYLDYAVCVDENDVYIVGGSNGVYAEAVKYLTDNHVTDGEISVPSDLLYIHRADYELSSLVLCGADISEYTLIYSGEATKGYAEDFATRVLEKTGKTVAVSDDGNSDGKKIFVENTAECAIDEYRIEQSDGNIHISSPTGMGLEAAYSEFCTRIFGQEGVKNMNVESVDKTGKIIASNDYARFISSRDGLANTAKKLTEDKKLTVAYYGGSVTVGHAASDREKYSWRARTTQWLKDNFPQAEITEINAAIGASGSHLGAFRVERDIIAYKPDLLFVEFAINDSYNGETADSAAENYEAIVRRVREVLPECDIVNIYVTDSGRAISGTHVQADAHDRIAESYGIPSVRVGNAVVAKYSLQKGNGSPNWKEYFTDIVHMTDKGFEEYYLVIKEFLSNELIFSDTSSPKAHTMPDKITDGADRELQFVTVTEDMLESLECEGYTYNAGTFNATPAYNGYLTTDKNADSNSLTFSFTGTELSLFMSSYTSGMVRYNVDGKSGTVSRNSMNNPFPIIKGLEYGEHTVTISIMFGDTTTANIGAFLVR